MRDIRSDLQDRANYLEKQINSELVRFERLIGQLKFERARKLAHLKAKREAVDRLTQLAAWQQEARGALVSAIAAVDGVANALANDAQIPATPIAKKAAAIKMHTA